MLRSTISELSFYHKDLVACAMLRVLTFWMDSLDDGFLGSPKTQIPESQEGPASPTSPAHLAVDCEFYKKKLEPQSWWVSGEDQFATIHI